jgi:hypothetical protein
MHADGLETIELEDKMANLSVERLEDVADGLDQTFCEILEDSEYRRKVANDFRRVSMELERREVSY